MDLKFFLNKFAKVDNIEKYTLGTIMELRKCYDDFMKSSNGVDPDFPMINFNEGGKETIKGKNKVQLEKEYGEQLNEGLYGPSTAISSNPK